MKAVKSKSDYSPAQWARLSTKTKRAINAADKKRKKEEEERTGKPAPTPKEPDEQNQVFQMPKDPAAYILTVLRHCNPESQVEVLATVAKEMRSDILNNRLIASQESERRYKLEDAFNKIFH